MSRRASNRHLPPITSAIIQGHFPHSRYPGPALFASNCRELARAYVLSRGRARLLPAARLFSAVERHTRILHQLRHGQYKVVPYLIDVAGRSASWLREPEDFRPRTTHGRDQLAELVRYLFESYRVPGWLRTALTPRRGRPGQAPAFGWYVHVAQGRSLRTAPGLPLPLSRRAAHEAFCAPTQCPPSQALLYGYLRAHGATDTVRTALLQATRGRDFVLDETWLKLFERIARAPAHPAAQIHALVDYARVRRAEGASLDVTVPTLLRGLARWQAARRELEYGPRFDERWSSPLPLTPLEGRSEHGDFSIRELCSLRELFEEGQVMQHCVFTYGHAARSGAASIWSLRITQAGQEVGRVTVRVAASERAVVEARRHHNHDIRPEERELLRRWASSQGLSLAMRP